MATVSKPSLKVNAAVNANGTSNGTGGGITLYTAPATGYAIINANISANTGGGYLQIGSCRVLTLVASSLGPNPSVQFIVGPSQSVSVNCTGALGTLTTAFISGVEFINS